MTTEICRRGALTAGLLAALGMQSSCATGSVAHSEDRFERYGHIERFAIASRSTGRRYTIEIYRPASYATSTAPCPVLFMLDGNYSFDAAVALSNYMQRDEIREHAIVGVSYDAPLGRDLGVLRTPDFTPPTQNGLMTFDQPVPYFLFLRDELLPEIGRRLRVAPDDTTLWTYSLSGSFATWLNAYDRSLFRNYIIASPNWGQFGIQQRLLEGVVFNAPGPIRRKLFISLDATTEIPADLEGPLRAFLDAGLPGYDVRYLLTRGETHTTSWFASLPTALRFIYGR